MKKVLVVTYYWPPSGGSGVQRWLKFAKYLPQYGWEPIIFTPENPDFVIRDESLLKDVSHNLEIIRFPIWEPYKIFRKITGRNEKFSQGMIFEDGKRGLLSRLAVWIRGNLIVPDPRKYWARPASRFILDIIQSNDISHIVTTGPPHSMHLIGLRVKRKAPGVTWIADFRDPWSNWDMLSKFKVSTLVRRRHRRLEKKVLEHSDLTLCVSQNHKEYLLQQSAGSNINVITNGFDEDDFSERSGSTGPGFRIMHVGLLNDLRDPESLWEALRILSKDHEGFSKKTDILLAGMISESIASMIGDDQVLAAITDVRGYLPHSELVKEYDRASVLLLVMNRSDNAAMLIPAKIFEYLALGKRILAIGPEDGEVARILNETGAGKVHDPRDVNGIVETLSSWYDDHQAGGLQDHPADIKKYTRRHLTGGLAKLMDEI